MATWQFTFNLIPNPWIKNPNNSIDKLYDDEGILDPYLAWENNQPKNLDALCNEILNQTTSWSKDLKIWGDTETNDIQVFYENSLIESISIRLDVREINKPFLLKIINFVNELNCLLHLSESKEIIEPNYCIVVENIMKSNAYRFVKDPHEFLNNIKSNET